LVPESYDFGLLFNQYTAAYIFPQEDKNMDSEKEFEFSAGLVPRVSFILGNIGAFFISGDLTWEFTINFRERLTVWFRFY